MLKGFILFSFVLFLTPVFASNTLQVCTAGDYPPLTYQNTKTNQFSGFDIAIIEKFAKYQKKKIRFIKTSWSKLTNALLNHKCDIAVGGITKTAKRSALFYTSIPLLKGRKAPIFSAYNSKYFNSFKSIDRPHVTVIENFGGTNYAYAKANIHRAKLLIVKKNAQTFSHILRHPKQPIVMITDNVEVQFRAAQSNGKLSTAGLKIKLPNNPITQKVYLIPKTPKGKKLLIKVNEYIHHLKINGNLNELYASSMKQKY